MEFKNRHSNKNEVIVSAIIAMRNGGNKEKLFDIIWKACLKVIFKFTQNLDDEHCSMVNGVLWDCILAYDTNSNAQFTTYLWGAFKIEQKKIEKWEKRLSPQSEDGKDSQDNTPSSEGYCGDLENIIQSQMVPHFEGVYTKSDDCVYNAMSTEYIEELKSQFPRQFELFEYMSQMQTFEDGIRYPTLKEGGMRFGYSQQYASRLMQDMETKIGYRHKKANKKRIKWDAIEKRVSHANSAEYFDTNGKMLSASELHAYRMQNCKNYRKNYLAKLALD